MTLSHTLIFGFITLFSCSHEYTFPTKQEANTFVMESISTSGDSLEIYVYPQDFSSDSYFSNYSDLIFNIYHNDELVYVHQRLFSDKDSIFYTHPTSMVSQYTYRTYAINYSIPRSEFIVPSSGTLRIETVFKNKLISAETEIPPQSVIYHSEENFYNNYETKPEDDKWLDGQAVVKSSVEFSVKKDWHFNVEFKLKSKSYSPNQEAYFDTYDTYVQKSKEDMYSYYQLFEHEYTDYPSSKPVVTIKTYTKDYIYFKNSLKNQQGQGSFFSNLNGEHYENVYNTVQNGFGVFSVITKVEKNQ